MFLTLGYNALAGNGINMHSGIVYTCSSNFYDGSGPSANYVNNQQDTLVVYPPANLPNAKICVTFHRFLTEETNDYLRVYDGNSVNAQLIKEMSGGIKYGSIKSTASDGSLTFLFHSNNTTTNEGWSATITVDTLPEDITMISGGKWHTGGGRFFDSGGPNNNYENNANNVITTIFPKNPGDKLSVVFHECNISSGDILSVFNGSAAGVNQIATITGSSDNYGTITSSAADGSLTFVFASNSSGNASGWDASLIINYHPEDITTIANGTFTVSKGRFFDSGGMQANYPAASNTTVTTLLPKNTGDKIAVTFHECNIASGDYLEVFDASSVSGNPIAVITGINTGTIKASNAAGALTFRFVTNASGNAAGWIASINTFNAPEEITMIANQTFTINCFARFYDNGGTANNYGDNKNIITTLTPSGINDKLTATFHSFNLNANDYLYVYDGPDTSNTLLGSFTGNLNLFNLTSTHATGSLTFKFVSNTSSNNYGWFATITCSAGITPYNMPLNTSANYTTSNAFFYDNGGPNSNYSDNSGLNSVVTFYPTNANDKMSATFTYFSTYNINDYLEVYDGDNVFSAPLIAKISNAAGYGTIKATNAQGCLTFRFISDASSNSGGWAAYLSTSLQPQTISLPGTYVTNDGWFMDAGGNGGNYADQINHVYTITPVSSLQKIGLSFTMLSTYNSNDFLEIHDGASITDPIIAVLNNNSGYGTIRASASNATGSLTIKFVSDISSSSLGWAAMISTDSVPEVIALPGTYTINEAKLLYDQGGPFSNYGDNINTVTYLRPQNPGDKVSVMFTLFNLYNNNDYIEIHDGPFLTDPIIANLGYNNGYGTITSSHASGCLTIKTISDVSSNGKGWCGVVSTTAQPKIISMTGQYITNNGFLMDDGGPDLNYNSNTNSVITINPASANSYVSANFNYFTGYNSNDSIQVFNGNSTNAPLLAVLKNSLSDTVFTSTATDGSLTFRIKTDGASVAPGWMAAISTNADCFYVGLPENHSARNEITVYPNPATDNIQIDLSSFKNEEIKIELFDVSGKQLLENNTRLSLYTTTLNYNPGVYFLKITSGSYSTIKKLIIQ
jgi:hypothetical protein